MFSINQRLFGKTKYYQLLNELTGDYVGILPAYGGLINDFVIGTKTNQLNILEGYKTEEDLRDNLTENYKGVKLSPFPNRIRDGKYSFENEEHALHVNFPNENNSIHGLLFDKNFEVKSMHADENGAEIVIITEYGGDAPGYPFSYTLEQQISFAHNNKLTVSTSIKNTDIRAIPMGDGWHPYFKTGSVVDELQLSFPSVTKIGVDDRMIPTDEETDFSAYNTLVTIGQDNFDDCFTLDIKNDLHQTVIRDVEKSIEIKIWQQGGDRGYNFLQVYTPPTRDCIAVEPMTCIPNAFNNEVGLFSLAPGEELTLRYGVAVSALP